MILMILNLGNKFHVARTISKGLQAVIKLVENQEGKQFAMKVFEPIGKEMQEKVLKDTRTEFQIVKSLNLTSIPKYYEFQEVLFPHFLTQK